MKNWKNKGNVLLKKIESAELNQGELKIWNIGQCGFIFKYGTKILVIDAVLNDFTLNEGQSSLNYELAFEPEALHVDYILCTHGHPDHFETKTVAGLQKRNPAAKVFIPYGCKNQAEENHIQNLVLLEPGVEVDIDTELNIKLKPLSAAHPVHVHDKNDPGMSLCYNVLFGKTNVVHLGDTYLTEELFSALTALPQIDLFFCPINGDDFFRKRINFIGNMEAEEAAKLAACLKPVLSVPTHYDMVRGNTADYNRFINQLKIENQSLKCFIPELGEGFSII